MSNASRVSQRRESNDAHSAIHHNASLSRIPSESLRANVALFSEQYRTQMTIKRIHREVADVSKEDLGQITLAPSEDNIFLWKATIPGPQGSVYEGT
jgi:hypothetical protein